MPVSAAGKRLVGSQSSYVVRSRPSGTRPRPSPGNAPAAAGAEAGWSWGSMARPMGAAQGGSLQETIYNSKLIRESVRILEKSLAKDSRKDRVSLSRQEALVCHRALITLLDPDVDDVKHRVHALPDDVKQYLLHEFADTNNFRRLESAHSMRSTLSAQSAGASSATSKSSARRKTSVPIATHRIVQGTAADFVPTGERGRSFSFNDSDFLDVSLLDKVYASDDGIGASDDEARPLEESLCSHGAIVPPPPPPTTPPGASNGTDSRHATGVRRCASAFTGPTESSSPDSAGTRAGAKPSNSSSHGVAMGLVHLGQRPRLRKTGSSGAVSSKTITSDDEQIIETDTLGSSSRSITTIFNDPFAQGETTPRVSAATTNLSTSSSSSGGGEGGGGSAGQHARNHSSPSPSSKSRSAGQVSSPATTTAPVGEYDTEDDETDRSSNVEESAEDTMESHDHFDDDDDDDDDDEHEQRRSRAGSDSSSGASKASDVSKRSGGMRLLHKRSGSLLPIAHSSLERTLQMAAGLVLEEPLSREAGRETEAKAGDAESTEGSTAELERNAGGEAELASKAASGPTTGAAMNSKHGEGSEVAQMIGKLDEWADFDVFTLSRIAAKGPLVVVGFAVLERQGLFDKLDLPVAETSAYLDALQDRYLDNPYHNALHSADVAHALCHFYVRCGLDKYANELLRFSSLFAALAHDVAHPGVTNGYLVRTWHPLAVRYNDRSPLEMMHASVAFEVLRSERCNLVKRMPEEDKGVFRKTVISLILATDNAEHDALLGRLSKTTQAIVNSQQRVNIMISDLEQMCVLEAALHAADISSSCKPWALYKNWTERLCVEFRNQGDLEKRRGLPVLPFMDRSIELPIHRFQSGFIEAIVQPLYRALNAVPDVSVDHCLGYLQDNLERWKRAQTDESAGVQLSEAPSQPARPAAKGGSTAHSLQRTAPPASLPLPPPPPPLLPPPLPSSPSEEAPQTPEAPDLGIPRPQHRYQDLDSRWQRRKTAE